MMEEIAEELVSLRQFIKLQGIDADVLFTTTNFVNIGLALRNMIDETFAMCVDLGVLVGA